LKVTIEEISTEQEEVIVRCRQMTPELLRVLSQLKSSFTLVAYKGNEIHRVSSADIYYIEVVDNSTFIYCSDQVFDSKQKLYELEELLSGGDFLRISKSVILNMSKIKSLSPALNGRFEAKLDNNEKVIISRQYVGDLKKRLGL